MSLQFAFVVVMGAPQEQFLYIAKPGSLVQMEFTPSLKCRSSAQLPKGSCSP